MPAIDTGLRRCDEEGAVVAFISLLALDRAGHAGDVVLDKKRIDKSDRDRAEEGPGHQLTPIKYVAANKLRGDPDRHRLLFRGGKEDERIDEFVPRQSESENT